MSRHGAIRVLQRILSTVVGLVVFGFIRFADPRGAWLIVVLVMLQFAIEVVLARHYALALAFITPTALTIRSGWHECLRCSSTRANCRYARRGGDRNDRSLNDGLDL